MPNRNPTGDYEIAVWFEDMHGTPIDGGREAQVPAPEGSPVAVVGGLAGRFEVTCGGVDGDVMRMKYEGDEWSSGNGGRCKVGGYDGGARDMSCTFSC